MLSLNGETLNIFALGLKNLRRIQRIRFVSPQMSKIAISGSVKRAFKASRRSSIREKNVQTIVLSLFIRFEIIL